MWGTYVRCSILQRPSFLGLLFMLCVLGIRFAALPLVTFFFYVVFYVLRAPLTQERFTGVLGRQPRGRGGSPAAIPLPLPGFLPQSPAFLLPHPPVGDDVKLHVSMMLHKTLRNEIWRLKSWKPSKNIRSPQEWGGLWKRERERKPLGGERISSLLRSLPSQRGCRSHTGKWVMRDPFG